MILSDFSIKRPLVVVVVTITLMLFGYFALSNLKTNQFPDVQPPVLVVNVPYPGASPETVEREILNRVEDSMSTIPGSAIFALMPETPAPQSLLYLNLIRI